MPNVLFAFEFSGEKASDQRAAVEDYHQHISLSVECGETVKVTYSKLLAAICERAERC